MTSAYLLPPPVTVKSPQRDAHSVQVMLVPLTPTFPQSITPPPLSPRSDCSGSPRSVTHRVPPLNPSQFRHLLCDDCHNSSTRPPPANLLCSILKILATILTSAAVGIAWGFFMFAFGLFFLAVLAKREPYRTANTSDISTVLPPVAVGGTILGGATGIFICALWWTGYIRPGTGRLPQLYGDALAFGTGVMILVDGFFGNALGVAILEGRVPCALDVTHALRANAVGQGTILGVLMLCVMFMSRR